MTSGSLQTDVQVPAAVLISDVDGTLRAHGEQLGVGVASFLRGLVRQGVLFIPASGKSVEYLRDLFVGHGIACQVLCGENGGHIAHWLDGRRQDVYCGDTDALEQAQEHLEACHECNGWRKVEPKRTIFTARFDNAVLALERAFKWRMHLGQILGASRVAVYTYPHDDAVDAVVEPHRISKANVVRFVRERFGAGMRIVVAGDGDNDVAILRCDGVVPVCPGNATPRAKAPTTISTTGYQSARLYSEGTLEGLKWAFTSMGIYCHSRIV